MDATFWALVALLLFISLIVYAGVPGQLTAALSARGKKIEEEIATARRLREQAEDILKKCDAQHAELETSVQAIFSKTEQDVTMLSREMDEKIDQLDTFYAKISEEKINQMRLSVLNDVKERLIETALQHVQHALSQKSAQLSEKMLRDALPHVSSTLRATKH